MRGSFWVPYTRYTLRRNAASIMKDLIYCIPVVFLQFIILIVLTGGDEFTVWQNGTILVNWKPAVCLFSSWFICSRICRFVQSAWLFSSWFTRSTNMSKQISRIHLTAKTLRNKSKLFSSMLFSLSPRTCFWSTVLLGAAWKNIIYFVTPFFWACAIKAKLWSFLICSYISPSHLYKLILTTKTKFLLKFSNPPSVIFLSKTRIKTNPLININIPGYTFLHYPSPTNAGGVGVYVSNDVTFSENQTFRLEVQGCENLWLDIKFPGRKTKYTFAVIYRHPSSNYV